MTETAKQFISVCWWCGKEYTATEKGYCSDKCKERASISHKKDYLKHRKQRIVKRNERYSKVKDSPEQKRKNIENYIKRFNYQLSYRTKNREKGNEQSRQWIKKNYQKVKEKNNKNPLNSLRAKTRYWLSDKKICCERCGNRTNLEFHHLSKNVYDIIVLCIPCHRAEHRKHKELYK